MIHLIPLVLALAPAPAKDPLEEAKALLGKEMALERVGKAAILATEPDDPTAEGFKQSEKGLLVRFYTNLRKTRVATARQDPFCLQALEKETGMGIEEVEKDFLRWLEAPPAAK